MASRGTSVSTHGHDSETSKGAALRSSVIHAHLVRRPGSGIVGLGGAAAAARRGRPKTKKSESEDSPSSPTAAGPPSSRSEQQLQQAPSTSLTNEEDSRTPRLPHSAVPIIGGITDHPTLSIPCFYVREPWYGRRFGVQTEECGFAVSHLGPVIGDRMHSEHQMA